MLYEPDREKIISTLVEQLHAYEKKYRMRSEIFFKLIVGTPLEDQEDFLDWATCYRQYFKLFQAELSTESAKDEYVHSMVISRILSSLPRRIFFENDLLNKPSR
ncbi:MAG: hypothetical protein ACREOI_29385 [bacterium]